MEARHGIEHKHMNHRPAKISMREQRNDNKQWGRGITSAPNRQGTSNPAVGPSVRGFMFCIVILTSPTVIRSSAYQILLLLADLPNDSHHNPARITLCVHQAKNRLVETDGLAHCCLQVEGLDVLPILFEEGDEEVDGQHDVRQHLVISHVDVTDGDTKAEHLLQLELNRGADLDNLAVEVFSVRDRCWELAGLGKTGTEKTGDLLDERFRGQEGIVFLGQFLHELLVLVQLLQVIHGHVFEFDLFRTIDIGGVGENADGHAGSGNVGEFYGSRETFITLGVVVLETDLKFNRLHEFAFLFAGCGCQEILDGAPHA